MNDIETQVNVWIKAKEDKHAEIMRLADDYADESRRHRPAFKQVGMPSEKRSKLSDAVWNALKL